MSYQTGHNHRRSLASQDHQTPMEPSHKNDLKPITKDHRHRHRRRHHQTPPLPIHPTPDPTLTTPPSTIQNISQRFSKLYTNHKKLVSTVSFRPHSSDLHPQPETYFPPKPITYSPVLDTSCTTLTKSRSQIERNGYNNNLSLVKKDHFFSSNAKAKDQDGSNKQYLSKNVPKKPAFEEFDVDKETKLTAKSLVSNEEVKKRIQVQPQGFEARRSSASSMVVVNNGGRRRSFCNSQVELADFLSCNGVKVVAVDMPPFMLIHAVDCARKAHDGMEKITSKTLALTLKKEFDGVYGPAWHCIVGTSFGSFVTHSVGGFMYFSMDHKLYILLFKTNVQRAES